MQIIEIRGCVIIIDKGVTNVISVAYFVSFRYPHFVIKIIINIISRIWDARYRENWKAALNFCMINFATAWEKSNTRDIQNIYKTSLDMLAVRFWCLGICAYNFFYEVFFCRNPPGDIWSDVIQFAVWRFFSWFECRGEFSLLAGLGNSLVNYVS